MKKNPTLYDDEIDLIALTQIILDGKIKILLITVIFFLVGFGYNYLTPRNYLNSLTIKPTDTVKITKLNKIKKLLELDQSQYISNYQTYSSEQNRPSKLYLVKFINELKDYDEFLIRIKNTKKIQENYSKLKIKDQKIELFQYVKLLEIVKSQDNDESYFINFKWHDPDEAKKVLEDTLYLVSKNLKKLVETELMQSLEFKEKLMLNKDKNRINFLKEQSAIAKELNIINNMTDSVNLSDQLKLSLNSNLPNGYYFRGYKAIDKEIKLIQNRNYENLEFFKKELNNFKKENINWIDYNIYLMEVKSLKNTKSILIFSILLGLIIGIIYVFMSHAYQSRSS